MSLPFNGLPLAFRYVFYFLKKDLIFFLAKLQGKALRFPELAAKKARSCQLYSEEPEGFEPSRGTLDALPPARGWPSASRPTAPQIGY